MPSVEQTKAEILREFRQDSRLRWADIIVEVEDATVTLTGTVASSSHVLAALEAVRRIESPVYVVNQLSVSTDARPSDEEIARAVRGALERDEVVPTRSIQVAVSNGCVALYGRAGRRPEREQAGRIARRTKGVRGVYNNIAVSPLEVGVNNILDANCSPPRGRLYG
jgi:osmotically-inducible protein OsmY